MTESFHVCTSDGDCFGPSTNLSDDALDAIRGEIRERKERLLAERAAIAEEKEQLRLGRELGKKQERERFRALDEKLLAMSDEPEEVEVLPVRREPPRTRPRRPDRNEVNHG